MMNLFLTLSLFISVSVSFYFWWTRRRAFAWLLLKRDYNDRLARLDELSYTECVLYVRLLGSVCDDLAMLRYRDYNTCHKILCDELERLTEILETHHNFFEKTDELGELDT